VVICSPERAGTYAMWRIVRELQRNRGDWLEYRAPRSWAGTGITLPDADQQARFGAMPSGHVVEVDGGGPHARAEWSDISRAASCWWTHSPLEWVVSAVDDDTPIVVLNRDLDTWAASYERWSGVAAPVGRWELFQASVAAALSEEVDEGAAGIGCFDHDSLADDECLAGVVSYVRYLTYDVPLDDLQPEAEAVAELCRRSALALEAPEHITQPAASA